MRWPVYKASRGPCSGKYGYRLTQDVRCSTTHLGKGTRCAPPLHPPGLGSYWASNPSRASGTYHRSITRRAWRRPSPPAPNHGSSELSRSPEPHSQGDFALPAPIDLGGVPAPKTPDHSMEAKDGSESPLPFLGTFPPSKWHSAPCNPDQPSAGWMPPTHRR